MAAPVGHIFCALALLNSGTADIVDKNAFMAGTNFSDSRYVTKVSRASTHKLKGDHISDVLDTPSAFEAGRRYHVFVDRAREQYMVKHNAYAALEKNGAFKTQMLKLIEDRILFEKIKGKINVPEIFSKIYPEERLYNLTDKEIETWHNLLIAYLDESRWFHITRYFHTFMLFRKAYGLPKQFFANFWQSLRSIGFFIYAYYQVEKLSRDAELRAIILDFYENEIERLIRLPKVTLDHKKSDAKNHKLRLTSVTMPRFSSTEFSTNPIFL